MPGDKKAGAVIFSAVQLCIYFTVRRGGALSWASKEAPASPGWNRKQRLQRRRPRTEVAVDLTVSRRIVGSSGSFLASSAISASDFEGHRQWTADTQRHMDGGSSDAAEV